jgi:hypothetical protein
VTYSVSAHSGDDRLADGAYKVPVFQKLVLVHIGVCAAMYNVRFTAKRPGRYRGDVHTLSFISLMSAPAKPHK